ncbi:hypothetical protein QC764_0045290 [Podospora pseudoanserina]|uniref:Uncharacterized protein n=1 Tax=Podospora pseudoanserina TaxID=2609844 RepID=A0ABR0IJ70_9PEZI|nr:hypothetical protein QC764_0045290 [Podospora pseudoanserina]
MPFPATPNHVPRSSNGKVKSVHWGAWELGGAGLVRTNPKTIEHHCSSAAEGEARVSTGLGIVIYLHWNTCKISYSGKR